MWVLGTTVTDSGRQIKLFIVLNKNRQAGRQAGRRDGGNINNREQSIHE